jgi:hypothetical protein
VHTPSVDISMNLVRFSCYYFDILTKMFFAISPYGGGKMDSCPGSKGLATSLAGPEDTMINFIGIVLSFIV